ncbi:MAG: DUF493 domain-containing protein [Gammaproteobacteria bacterium]|nr:DUF493 domain-containing protein [Gammaproteobacteria bacterium]
MSESPGVLEFPCEFPIKIFAASKSDILAPARAIVERHVGQLDDHRVTTRASKAARYVAIKFTVTAKSQDQLDAIYRELTAHEDVVMAL